MKAKAYRAAENANADIRPFQDILGHADVSTTMIYLHLTDKKGAGATQSLGSLDDLSQPRSPTSHATLTSIVTRIGPLRPMKDRSDHPQTSFRATRRFPSPTRPSW